MLSSSSIKFGHVGLNCVDIEVTEHFYSRFFGFTRDADITLGETRLLFISSGDVVFELFEAIGTVAITEGGSGPSLPGFRHLAIQVPDVSSVLKAIDGHTEITQGPLDLSGHGLSPAIAWIRDPDGRILEMYE